MVKNPIDEDILPPFSGFPREGLSFLRKLKKNNNRPWFQKHKQEFEEVVRFPMQCLVASLGAEMSHDAPDIEFNPKRSIFRIYRDVRFSRNKSPYKTHIAASFQPRGRKGGEESPGLYLHIEPGQVFIGAGLYMPNGDQLKAIRNAIVKDPGTFLEIIRNRRFKKEFGGIQGDRLQKAPLGFPKDHPMIEHLRNKQFFVGKELEDAVSLKPGFVDQVAGYFRISLPLVRWLVNVRS
jgi:uncharacterized protein (TIGR02453 family)